MRKTNREIKKTPSSDGLKKNNYDHVKLHSQRTEEVQQSINQKYEELQKSDNKITNHNNSSSKYEDLQKVALNKLRQIADQFKTEANASPDQQQTLDGETIVRSLHGMKDRLQLSDQPPSFREIVRDFQLITAMNLVGIQEVLKDVEKGKPVDLQAARKLHTRIFGSIGGSGGYYLYIRNHIPLESQEEKDMAAKLLLKPSIGRFVGTIQAFCDELDSVLPWKYTDSSGIAFGIKPEFSSDQKISLSLDNQQRLKPLYEKVRQAENDLSAHLEELSSLGISEEKRRAAMRKATDDKSKRREAQEETNNMQSKL